MAGDLEHLDQLENRSVHILREAYANFKNLGMLWSIGKDSTVLLWLARKAFFGHVPIPLIHIDTAYKSPEMIEYRDRLALEWNLTMIYGQNRQALDEKRTYPDGAIDRIACCKALKTDALNERSRGAMEAMGATFEGIHRKHMLVRDGENRDSAWYSITDDEWRAVERGLVERLA